MKKLHIGFDSIGAHEEFLKNVLLLHTLLRTGNSFEAFETEALPLFNSGESPVSIFKKRVERIRACDGMLALCEHPSMALGIEIEIARTLGKKLLLVAPQWQPIPLFVIGMPSITFKRYRHWDEIPTLVRAQFLLA